MPAPSTTTRRGIHAALDLVTGAAVTTQGSSTETLPPLFTGSQPQLNSGAGGPTAGNREQAAGRLSHLLVTWCPDPVATDLWWGTHAYKFLALHFHSAAPYIFICTGFTIEINCNSFHLRPSATCHKHWFCRRDERDLGRLETFGIVSSSVS